MPQNKPQVFCFVIAVFFIGAIFLYGCGSVTGGGGGGGGSSGLNNGTVSGTVYIFDRYTQTNVPTPDAYVIASSESMSKEVSCKSGSDGKYVLNGVSPGLITVTVTREGIQPRSTACNSSTINLFAGNIGTPPAGSVTIRGTIEGLTATPTYWEMNVNNLSKKVTTTSITIDETNGTFEITGARINDMVYVVVLLEYASGPDDYLYAYVDTTGGGVKEIIIQKDNNKTIEAHVAALPTGYQYDGASVYLTRDDKSMGLINITDDKINPDQITPLPTLKGSDNYDVKIYATNEALDLFCLHNFGCPLGHNDFNLSSYAMPQSSLIISPSNGDNLTVNTTFEWHTVPDASYYSVYLRQTSPTTTFSWYVYTTDTKTTLPTYLADQLTSGTYKFYVWAGKYIDFPGIDKIELWDDNTMHLLFYLSSEERTLNVP